MYITYTDVATFLQVTFTAPQQAVVTQIIEGLESYANRFMNRTFNAGQTTEKFDGGYPTFYPRNIPIATIDEVNVDGAVLPSTEYFNYTSYIRFASTPAFGIQNISIKYTPDTNIPDDLQQALIQWVADVYSATGGGTGNTGTVDSVTVGPASISYGSTDTDTHNPKNAYESGIPAFVLNVLTKHRIDSIV